MLSIERCRELLGGHCQLSDEEVSGLRDHLYALAGAVFEAVGIEESQSTDIGFDVE